MGNPAGRPRRPALQSFVGLRSRLVGSHSAGIPSRCRHLGCAEGLNWLCRTLYLKLLVRRTASVKSKRVLQKLPCLSIRLKPHPLQELPPQSITPVTTASSCQSAPCILHWTVSCTASIATKVSSWVTWNVPKSKLNRGRSHTRQNPIFSLSVLVSPGLSWPKVPLIAAIFLVCHLDFADLKDECKNNTNQSPKAQQRMKKPITQKNGTLTHSARCANQA